MRIAILGSGLMGSKLGTIFAEAGHEVVFSYARDPRKLEQLARAAGENARAGTPAEAVKDADIVFIGVHWSRLDDVLAQAGALKGKIVITCALPTSDDDTRLLLGHTTSGAEILAERASGAHVVSAFGTVPSEVLHAVFQARHGKTRPPPDLFFCGDHAKSKSAVAQLIRDAGFNPVDAGALTTARYLEPMALLMAEIVYNDPAGPETAYRLERYPPA